MKKMEEVDDAAQKAASEVSDGTDKAMEASYAMATKANQVPCSCCDGEV